MRNLGTTWNFIFTNEGYEIMKGSTAALLSTLALLVVVSSGCVTKAVWEDGPLARYREPAPSPNLEVFCAKDRSDFLVKYNETQEGSSAFRRRAYWVNPNEVRLKQNQRPRFVSLEIAKTLDSVPLHEENSMKSERINMPAHGMYAVLSTNGITFAIYSSGKAIFVQDLPNYRDWSGRTKQVLLTPPAVIADTTVVGAVVAWYCLPGLWSGLNSFTR